MVVAQGNGYTYGCFRKRCKRIAPRKSYLHLFVGFQFPKPRILQTKGGLRLNLSGEEQIGVGIINC
jgi:hypothetical protein